MRPGRAAAARSSIARLSGPPETARPTRASAGISASRSCRNRSTKMRSGSIPSALSTSAALRLSLGVRFELLEVWPDLGTVDRVQLGICLAGLAGLPQLHQRLAKVEEAVGCTLPARIASIIGEERIGGASRIAFVELRTADEVVRVADPAVLRKSGGK